ncbi:hypothetical protein [Ligilactobacillus agilis]|uniref:hypothetical protein n=1 Tax=Ligilactobacillus agilis TaxID=1601 RepID=UPI003F8C504A
MLYYYEIDENDNFILSGHDIHKRVVTLNEFQVKTLKRILGNDLLGNFLERSDCLRKFLEEGSIDLETHYKLIKALVNWSFETNFEIAEPKFYVHVLPDNEGYLNVFPDDEPYLDDNKELGNAKTKFTKSEIEDMKCDEHFKGINFDECLERVEEDEE